MGDIVQLHRTKEPRVVYYVEIFQDITDPTTTQEPFKRLGPFDHPIAFNHFGTFENGYDDDEIGLTVEYNLDIVYVAQPDDEEGKKISMVRIVAEVAS